LSCGKTPAVWIAHNMMVDLHDMPKRYGCEDLRHKFRDMLLSIGARQDLKVVPYRCSRNHLAPRCLENPAESLSRNLRVTLFAYYALLRLLPK
jgi:hypothetical protein